MLGKSKIHTVCIIKVLRIIVVYVKNSNRDMLCIIVVFVTSFCDKEKLRRVVVLSVTICCDVCYELILWLCYT